MTATSSVSSKDHHFDLTPPKNFVRTEAGQGLVDVFEPALLGLLEDLEDAADGDDTRRLYETQGAAAFRVHRL
jgi:hypothetical protein